MKSEELYKLRDSLKSLEILLGHSFEVNGKVDCLDQPMFAVEINGDLYNLEAVVHRNPRESKELQDKIVSLLKEVSEGMHTYLKTYGDLPPEAFTQ